MDAKQFKQALRTASNDITDYLDNISSRPVQAEVSPGYLRQLLPARAPQDGQSWDQIHGDLFSKILPGMTHWNSPNFLAFFPAPTSYPSMLGELYSAALTTSAFNWDCAPAVTELETIVMDWVARMLNLPESYLSTSTGGGVIQGTTSEAVIAVMVAARERYLRQVIPNVADLDEVDRENAMAKRRANLVAIGSEASHSCTQKAALIIGVRYRSVPVSIDDDFSMRGQRLQQTIAKCREEGLEPFYLTATLGTTSTCAVDKLEEIAEVLKDESNIWVHVDAAFAGNALVCEEYQDLTKSFGAFNSFSTALSKWLLVNLDACCLFVKEREQLIDALSIHPAYLRNTASDSGKVIDYRNWQIPLSRRFRALKIWFVMRSYGQKGFKKYIRNHIKLGEAFAKLIASKPDLFEIVVPPAFALTVISVRSEIGDREEASRLTRAVYESINKANEVMLTSTVVGGNFVIRVVGANPNTTATALQKAFEILVSVTEECLGKFPTISNGCLTGFNPNVVVPTCISEKDAMRSTGDDEIGLSRNLIEPQYSRAMFSLWDVMSKLRWR
ncbi:MAG: hypothetical protein LQ352_007213 [Teloschistes flavicans]|nr:MAG: hypothetical protein LQ352_007213 [Teloschistes flavicans]